MKRAIVLLFVMLIVTGEALACSLSPLELKKVASEFDVYISHRSKPISGVRVEMVSRGAKESVFSGSTDDHGMVHVNGLPVGEYFLTASYAGIDTQEQWIEVVDPATADKHITRKLDLQWADWSIQTNRVRGVLTGVVPGNTGNKIQDMVHPVSVIYSGVQISLKNAFSEEAYSGVSDSSGDFIFGPVNPGTYLLTIAGGSKYLYGIASETTIVLDVAASSKRDWLKMKLQDNGCGGIEFEVDEQH